MFTKIKLLTYFLLFSLFQANAQSLEYKKYKWEAEPKLHDINTADKEGNYTVLLDKTIVEFAYNSENQLEMFETKHTIIRLNNDKGIEAMNKVYISTASAVEEIDLKARTITSAGKVINLNKSAIKKVDNYEDAGPFTIFAMEGIDVGSEIEYIYTNKRNFRLNNSVFLQTDKIKKNVSIDIYSPENLVYIAKGYNGFPEFTEDTIIKKKNHIYASVERIEALNDEKYSATQANKMRYDYQIAYNTAKSNARIYNWEQIGNNVYANLFTPTKQETKAVSKLISKLGLVKLSSDEAKIRALEQFAKTSIVFKEIDEYITVDKMLDIKYGNSSSLQRLYVGVANELQIPIEVVLTTDRFERKFDATFQSLNSTMEYLLYFPSIGKFLSAEDFFSRLGYPTAGLTGQKGIFIKETSIGDIKTGVTKVKNIEATDVKYTYNNLDLNITFEPESLTPIVKIKHTFMGYLAASMQATIPLLDKEKRKEVEEDLSKFMGVETVVKSTSLKGIDSKDVMVNPFIVESTIETPHLIENAGKKYLFKVGEMIGAQEQLYQEKQRQTDADILFTHSYERNFEIKIPAGYKAKNLENLAIDKRYVADGKELASFVSTYKVEGDVIKINIIEDYKILNYPKANFETFRSVINASADFNKVIIIFEK
jgi:hypothetical protein